MTRSDEDRLRDITDAAAMAMRVADEGEDAFAGLRTARCAGGSQWHAWVRCLLVAC